jgi:beta-galactosidase
MKRISFLILCISLSSALLAQPAKFLDNIYYYIENTSVFELNQEEGRTYFMPQKSLSLNGDWKFFYSETPEGIPKDFYTINFNDEDWDFIEVPTNWEMQGFGDRLFRNVATPFPVKRNNARSNRNSDIFAVTVPNVPREYNPTGAYKKTFIVPDTWQGDQIFLRMEKTASASFVWINGEEVGYNEGAQEPAEYNITKYLKSGINSIAVFVTKYSDGYYLEGQDYWRFAGIFDDVNIYAAPNVRLFDWQVITDLDDSYTDATLSVGFDVKKYLNAPAEDYKIRAFLFDNNKVLIKEIESDEFKMDLPGNEWVNVEAEISNPLKWTAETPHLYNLKMQLLTSQGVVVDSVEQVIGFKETLIEGDLFTLNGVPIKINATNSHMQHHEMGHTMTEEIIRKDFEILKQLNFNSVRTAHYPPVNKYLELANEYGLYIIDEAGVEAHATEYVSDMPEFTEMYRERVRKMVLRDRNYPSIIFWSAGNESGEGFNISEVVKEGKSLDPTRYWMYGGNGYSHPAEDIIGPRYPSPLDLDMLIGNEFDNDVRPSFMDEYLSVAGNALGGLDDYWHVIYSYPRTLGGAIWDFVSPGITEKIRSLDDKSGNNVPVHLMGNNIKLVEGKTGNAVNLNGHDQWVEIYRHENLEIDGDKLTITMDVFPRKLNASGGQFITKGSNQYGIVQRGNDSLEFYIYTNTKQILRTALPSNWENNWHKLTAIYDGQKMLLYINENLQASKDVRGNIKNFPFTISLGRDSEVDGSQNSGYMSDAMLDNVGVFNEAVLPHQLNPEKAVLWLDFENETDHGTFLSYGAGARTYGHISGNREIEPENWEMKKVGQPIAATLLDAELGIVEIWNRNFFTNASQYDTKWYMEADGEVIQEGTLPLNIDAMAREVMKVPYTKPELEAGKEYRITISSFLKDDEIWAKSGHEVAWSQFVLPWKKEALDVEPTNLRAHFTQTENEIIVKGDNFEYIIDKNLGALSSMMVDGKKMLKSPFLMSVWRAPMANDVDDWGSGSARSSNWQEGYGNYVSTEFYSAGIDQPSYFPAYTKVLEVDGKVYLNIRQIVLFTDKPITVRPVWGIQYNGVENIFNFIISGDGEITIEHTAKSQGRTLPLYYPRFGLSVTLDQNMNHVKWYGRGPQENYPGRNSGYKVGVYSSTVDEMFVPYIKPGDYGLRTDNRWVRMVDEQGKGLEFKVNELFNFNAYPFSTENLTKSIYTYQLQKQDGITFNLDYETTGVGDSSAGVLRSYWVYPGMFKRTIKIKPLF